MRTLMLLVAACAITLAFQPAGAQDYITLTTGGGVTGNTTVFRISTSGEVAKGSGSIEPAFSEFAQLRKGRKVGMGRWGTRDSGRSRSTLSQDSRLTEQVNLSQGSS
jgi:hypothetical protein